LRRNFSNRLEFLHPSGWRSVTKQTNFSRYKYFKATRYRALWFAPSPLYRAVILPLDRSVCMVEIRSAITIITPGTAGGGDDDMARQRLMVKFSLPSAYLSSFTVVYERNAVCFRSLSRDDSDRPEAQQCSDYSDSLLLSQSESDARPQSGSFTEPHHQVVNDDASTSTPTPRTVRTRRCKKSSKAAVYSFADPLSKATRSLNLGKLARSEFDWRMLTAIRPTSEFEERLITRLVELERLQVRLTST